MSLSPGLVKCCGCENVALTVLEAPEQSENKCFLGACLLCSLAPDHLKLLGTQHLSTTLTRAGEVSVVRKATQWPEWKGCQVPRCGMLFPAEWKRSTFSSLQGLWSSGSIARRRRLSQSLRNGSKPHHGVSCRELQRSPAIMVLRLAPEEALPCSTQPFG